MSNDKPMKTTKVKLAKAHTHGSKAYKGGDEIEVNDADLKWLTDHKLIDDGKSPALAPVPSSGKPADPVAAAKS